nr:hypothetical protein Iba_chr13dCG8060 [Ipomoea batatas]
MLSPILRHFFSIFVESLPRRYHFSATSSSSCPETATQATSVARIINRDSDFFKNLEWSVIHRSSLSAIDYNHTRRLLSPAVETQEVEKQVVLSLFPVFGVTRETRGCTLGKPSLVTLVGKGSQGTGSNQEGWDLNS